MATDFRIIDTGLRSGRENIAFDQALVEARSQDAIPDTIRFLRFPPTALVGRHQDLGREVNVDYCRRKGIGLARRITGGGAIYFDEGQLGWELVFRRGRFGFKDLSAAAAAICGAAAKGLTRQGVDACFRPRNDIEVGGRKLCGTGGFFDGDVLFYQGTLLIDLNPADMVAALNVPRGKTAKHGLDDPGRRVVTLKELLGDACPRVEKIKAALAAGFAEELGIEAVPGAVTAEEERLARDAFQEEIGTDRFVHAIDGAGGVNGVLSASRTGPGGTVTAYVRLDGPATGRIREVLITGDFFVTPPRTVFDLEASLRGVKTAEVANVVERFFDAAAVETLSLSIADLVDVLSAAVNGH